MRTLAHSATPLGAWLRALLGRVHRNAVIVALANKLTRIAWAVLRGGKHSSRRTQPLRQLKIRPVAAHYHALIGQPDCRW